MKYIVVILLSFSASVFAAQTGQTMIGDPEVGTFIIRTTVNEEPVWYPLLYTLLVKCKGQQEPRVLKSVKICRMTGHTFDQATKDLNVRYVITGKPSATETPCSTPKTSRKKITKVNLVTECAKK